MIKSLYKLILVAVICATGALNAAGSKKFDRCPNVPVLFWSESELNDKCLEVKEYRRKVQEICDWHQLHCDICPKDCNCSNACIDSALKPYFDGNQRFILKLKAVLSSIAKKYSACAIITRRSHDYEYIDDICDVTDEVIYRLNKDYIKGL